MAELRTEGYRIVLVFLWLPSADEAVARVAQRVRDGGHDVPEATIRRRYAAGIKNLVTLYTPLVDRWQVIDNHDVTQLKWIVTGGRRGAVTVFYPLTWQSILDRVQIS